MTTTTAGAARCLSCGRPLVASLSIARGFGPYCFTRAAHRQRHERAEAIHARLRALMRRVHDLDAGTLSVIEAALDGVSR